MLISFNQIKRKYNMNITGIVHVGGHHGEEIQDYINEGIQNIIIFEPLLNNFKILEQKCKNLNADIIGHQVALGSEKKIVEMYVSSNDALSSSILKPKIHLTQYTDILFDEKETVEVNLLDNYETDTCNFLNMDVQGYELEVLKGGIKTLEHIDYVYCEVNRDEVYENNAYIEDIDQFLSNLNFERVVVEWTGETWGDALYIKKNENI
jgi:FkbM family methyltransferase